MDKTTTWFLAEQLEFESLESRSTSNRRLLGIIDNYLEHLENSIEGLPSAGTRDNHTQKMLPLEDLELSA
jgi:hypothetical protein